MASAKQHELGPLVSADAWWVYFLAASDSTCFKVGFTGHVLQRLYSFNPRYFDYIDLQRSLLLRLSSETEARAVELLIKREFAASSATCPWWVRQEAGGYTEWFNAERWDEIIAKARLQLSDPEFESVFAVLSNELNLMVQTFESWAFAQATALQSDIASAQLGYERRMRVAPLRDWLDAYRHFAIELFADDEAARRFVDAIARSDGD